MNTTTETQLEFDFMRPEQLTFDYNDTKTYFSTGSSYAQLVLKPSYKVSFHREGRTVGVLDWNDGPMKFEGDAEESAQLFFDNIIKRYVQSYIKFDKPPEYSI
jgi:hypothetical protein